MFLYITEVQVQVHVKRYVCMCVFVCVCEELMVINPYNMWHSV